MSKKKHEEHENHERWLVSYADFITLLFAFFTVLYATAQTDQQKLEAVVDGMTAAFEGGMPDAILDVVTLKQGSELDGPHVNMESAAEPDLRTLKRHLEGSLTDNVVQIGLINQTLTMSLPDTLCFAPGSAELHPASFDVLARIAEAIAPTQATIQVIGRADGVPVNGGLFVDNWGLSAARAVAAVRYLERHGVPVERLTATGSLTSDTDADARTVTFKVRLDQVSGTMEVLERVGGG